MNSRATGSSIDRSIHRRARMHAACWLEVGRETNRRPHKGFGGLRAPLSRPTATLSGDVARHLRVLERADWRDSNKESVGSPRPPPTAAALRAAHAGHSRALSLSTNAPSHACRETCLG